MELDECLRDYEQTKIAVKRLYLRLKGRSEKLQQQVTGLEQQIKELQEERCQLLVNNEQLKDENERQAQELEQACSLIAELSSLFGTKQAVNNRATEVTAALAFDARATSDEVPKTQDESGAESVEHQSSEPEVINIKREEPVEPSIVPSQYVHDDSLNLEEGEDGQDAENCASSQGNMENEDNGDRNMRLKRARQEEPLYLRRKGANRPPLRDVTNKNNTNNNSNDMNKLTIESIRNRKWHPGDFVMNPEFESSVESHGRNSCVHGTNCENCSAFYEMAGQGIQPSGPKWNPQSTVKSVLKPKDIMQRGSRHRSVWQRPPSPPGFWRSEFPTTQENENERQKMQQMRDKTSRDRLQEALTGGKWLFRDAGIQKYIKEQRR